MNLPHRVSLSPDDIAEFDRLLDDMPHRYAKGLAAWMDHKIFLQWERDQREAAIAVERAMQTASEPPSIIDAYDDQTAKPAPIKIH